MYTLSKYSASVHHSSHTKMASYCDVHTCKLLELGFTVTLPVISMPSNHGSRFHRWVWLRCPIIIGSMEH